MAKKFFERRSGHDRRDWDVFFHPNRRSGKERRSGVDRRTGEDPAYAGPERRRPADLQASPQPKPGNGSQSPDKEYYSTAEVADMTGLSQTTLLLWIRNKIIDGSRIKRSLEGKRLWTKIDIDEIRRVKTKNGWLE